MEVRSGSNVIPVERRRHQRYKVQSPAYASISPGVGGVVLDAHERGVAVESVVRLQPQSFVDLRLDLLETRDSVVTPARVAWSEEQGRAGLEFLNLTGESRRQLQQWLLLNTLLASERVSGWTQSAQAPPASVQAEKEQPSGDAHLQQMAEQALAQTGADGAAIALADETGIVCRATAGEVAPPPGSKLDTASGISGACLRSGRWLRCDDPRLDPHVDRESCQALGINSVLAVPIGTRENILGLIEVFSRRAYAFRENHCSALQKLAASIAGPRPEAPEISAGASEPLPRPEATSPAAAPAPTASIPVQISAAAQVASAAPEPAPGDDQAGEGAAGIQQRPIILGMLAAVLIVGVWFALGRGAGESKKVDAAEAPAYTSAASGELPRPDATAGVGRASEEYSGYLLNLRRRAESGDAEAQFELGARYASGEDVRQDYAEAVKWFTRAAEGGQVLAAATLGAYYWAGRGVTQDDVTAYMWSSIAKDGGDEASKYRIAILRARMTEAEIAEAEQRASTWRRAHPLQPLASKGAPRG